MRWNSETPNRRSLLGWLCLLLSAVLIIAFTILAIANARPTTLHDSYGDAQVSYTADRSWVVFPGDCTDVSWTVTNAVSATFFPTVEPGIRGGDGVRGVFFLLRIYQPGLTIVEDASGGTTEHFSDGQTITRSASACVDYTTEPKLRVHFKDGSSKSYKLGLDATFLRVEIWALITAAVGLAIGGLWLLGIPSKYRVLRLGIWFSTAFLLFYAFAFLRHPDFLRTYLFDAFIFFSLVTFSIFLSLFIGIRPHVVDRWFLLLRSSPVVPIAVVGFWLWVLSFGYTARVSALVSEFFWLPFFLWAFIIGISLIWWAQRADNQRAAPLISRRIAAIIALMFLSLSFVRDLFLFHVYSVAVVTDSFSYFTGGETFLAAGSSIGLPKRIFPYLFMNFITQSAANPVTLIILQAAIGAVAVGLLVYVLARKNFWWGVGTGFLLALNLTWGTYNRAILTEGPFVSFHVLCFAFMIWHSQRRHVLPLWELFAFGALCAWTFLFRGTGLPLIVPVLIIYYSLTRSWIKPLFILLGFAVVLIGISSFNLWRYNEFGLVGPQKSTLASALFSYHMFSAENGPQSQKIDAALHECMGYLDYDDAPRHTINFIHYYQYCLEPQWGANEVTAVTAKALQELILSKPSEFSRLLIEEVGTGLSLLNSDEFFAFTFIVENVLLRESECNGRLRAWCNSLPEHRTDTIDATLVNLSELFTLPNQLYLVVEQITSRSPGIVLFAFIMFCGFLWVTTNEKLLITICAGFAIYQLLSISIVHTIIPRYRVVLSPFFAVLSVLAVVYFVRWISRVQPRITWRLVMVLALASVYVVWANDSLRRAFTAPLFAKLDVNLFQKYGMTDLDFLVYQELIERSASAFFPETQATYAQALWHYGKIYHPFDLLASGQSRIKGWEFTRLPGYLRDVGASHLLLDAEQWASLPPPDQAILTDPAHYRLIGEWHDAGESRRLFEVVGDARSTYPAHDQNGIVVFEQPDRSLDVYRLDENRNGVFVTHIDLAAVASGTFSFEGEAGWSVALQQSPTGGYKLLAHDAKGEVVDDSFIVHLP